MKLKNYLLLLGAGITFSAPAIARNPQQCTLPKPPGMSDRVYSIVNAKWQQYDRAIRSVNNTAAKTTASAQRLIGQAYYEWGSASPQLFDSSTMQYSGSRGSKFSDYLLSYDVENPMDQPGDVEYQDTYVNYDTLRYYDMNSGSGYRRWRNYNTANQVTLSQLEQNERKVYSYQSDGKLAKVITMQDQGSGLDSNQREFYTYSTGTFSDKIETFDSSSMSWTHAATYTFRTNASSHVTGIDLLIDFGGSLIQFTEQTYTYAPNGKVRTAGLQMADFSTGTLMPYTYDTIGYSGNAMVYENFSVADQTTGALAVVYMERRRLNAQGLADSVSQISVSGGTSGYLKLSYNANGYPTRVTSYTVGNPTADNEMRYYYELNPNSVQKVNAMKPLTLAPNPAVNQIRLDNRLDARFRILDLTGRLMMNGSVPAGGSLSVDGLTPGIYSITLSDASGDAFSGRFVKQ